MTANNYSTTASFPLWEIIDKARTLDQQQQMNTTTSSVTTAYPPSELSSTSQCVDIKDYLWQNSSDLTSIPSTSFTFAIIYSFIVTLGVLGNSLVVLSVLRHRSLRSVRNMFIVSLSCSDIIACIVSGTITPITGFTKVWLFGGYLCKLVPVIQGSSLCFSTLTLTAISIDRYILIIYPTKRAIQKQQALKMIALNCIIAISISSPMFFKQQVTSYNDFCGEFCSEYWGDDEQGRSTYGTTVFIVQFLIPFFIIAFSYLAISLRLSRGMMVKQLELQNSSHNASFNAPGNNATHHHNKLSLVQSEQRRLALKRRLRTNRMLMAMVFLFIVCWLPSMVFNFLRDYQWLPSVISSQEYLYGIITHCISMTSTVWNPILYALLNEQYRLAFAELLHSLRRRRNSDYALGANESQVVQQRCARLASNPTCCFETGSTVVAAGAGMSVGVGVGIGSGMNNGEGSNNSAGTATYLSLGSSQRGSNNHSPPEVAEAGLQLEEVSQEEVSQPEEYHSLMGADKSKESNDKQPPTAMVIATIQMQKDGQWTMVRRRVEEEAETEGEGSYCDGDEQV